MKYLRTLTLKSQFKFGQFIDLTVQEVINLDRIGYLWWVYFNCSMINFMPDVLEKIYIPEELQIDKPGTKPEFLDILQKGIKSRNSPVSIKIHDRCKKKQGRAKNIGSYIRDRKAFGKYAMQRRNQGHR